MINSMQILLSAFIVFFGDRTIVSFVKIRNYLITDVTPILQNPADFCISRHCGENRNPVLSGVPDTGFLRYDDSA